MKRRKLLIVLLCFMFAFSVTACGGSKSDDSTDAGKGEETKEEKQEEDPTIEITGEEVTSGTLTVTLPEGWEVCPNERDNNWEANETYKVLESANKKESGGSVYGDVYVTFELSDYSEIGKAYNEDLIKEMVEKYGDEEFGLPKEYTFNDNKYLGYRQYNYVGDSAEDWAYLCYGSDGKLIEIRAYNDGDVANDENRAAIKMILASLKINGEPVGIE